jgi:hypothetical protein
VVVAEAARVRDALRDTERFYNVARVPTGRFLIQSSQEIVDALTACIEELSR